jgi:hypothetical protein
MLTRSQTRNQTSPTSNSMNSMVTRSQSRNKFFEEEEVVIRAPTLRNKRAVIADYEEDAVVVDNSRTHSMTTRSMKR